MKHRLTPPIGMAIPLTAAVCGLLAASLAPAIEPAPGVSTDAPPANEQPNSTAASTPTAASPARAAEKPLPRGLDKIVELAKSGVDTETQVAFVQSTAVAYNLSADEILRLHKNGVSSEVITALIRHGNEVREQMKEEWKARQSEAAAQAAAQAEPVQSAPVYSAAPSYYAPPQPVYAASQYVYPPVSYSYYTYPASSFLVIGTSHHSSGYRCSPSYFSSPGFYSPAVRISRPVSYAVSTPVVPAGFFRDTFQFRH